MLPHAHRRPSGSGNVCFPKCDVGRDRGPPSPTHPGRPPWSIALNLRRGFSLLELLAVVVILGIIAALIVPRVGQSSDTAKEKMLPAQSRRNQHHVEQYYIHNGVWPADNLSDIGADVNYFPDGLPTCPVSGQPYRLDPMTHRVVGHAGPGDHSP